MWADRRLIDLLGCAHPILLAPMAGSTTPALVAAVSNAGGVGGHGCAMMTPDQVAADAAALRGLTNGPVNLNFFCHRPPREGRAGAARDRLAPWFAEFGLGEVPEAVPTNFPFGAEMLEALLAARPRIASFHFGLPPAEMVAALKDAGVLILSSATSAAEARDLEARGVDAVIAQGWEAGGHRGYYLTEEDPAIGTMALVPQLADAVSVPVIAAGGIADGRGIAAALALGAAGVQIGTAFLTAEEASVPAPHRAALMAGDGAATRTTPAFSGRPARGIVNRYMEGMAGVELPDFPLMNTLTGPLRKASSERGSPDFIALWAGQARGLQRALPAADLLARLVEETRAAFARHA